jgi:AcrR family transcriptional regulator
MREEILDTSLQRFLKFGIRKMTIQKLVAPLGISTKTVYKYFSDKEALLKECLAIHYARLLEGITDMENQANAVQAIQNLWQKAVDIDFGTNHLFYQDLNYYYPELQDEILQKYRKKISAALIMILHKGTEEGLFRKDLNGPVILETMTVLYSSLTRTNQFKKFRMQPHDLAQQTIMVYLRGICTEKGLKKFN